MKIASVVAAFIIAGRKKLNRTGILVYLLAAMAMSVFGGENNPPVQGDKNSPSTQQVEPIAKGLRIFTIGHSFHAAWLPQWLKDVVSKTDIKGHEQVGVSMIGGSRVIQHWAVPDEQPSLWSNGILKNQAKIALREGKVDVLTLSPMLTPDEGISNFAKLALEHNPNIRVTVQEFWLPFDKLDCFGETFYGEKAKQLRNWADPPPKGSPPTVEDATAHFNVPTAEQIRKLHEPYFANMDAYVVEQNKQFGKQVLFVVPVGQAVNALREKIIDGKAPGIQKQSELFTDSLGHPNEVIAALSAYCHLAVIYHRNPIGLPVPPALAKSKFNNEALNLLLQELAWDAVTHHPLSGVTGTQPVSMPSTRP